MLPFVKGSFRAAVTTKASLFEIWVADLDSYPISLDSVIRGTIDWQPQT